MNTKKSNNRSNNKMAFVYPAVATATIKFSSFSKLVVMPCAAVAAFVMGPSVSRAETKDAAKVEAKVETKMETKQESKMEPKVETQVKPQEAHAELAVGSKKVHVIFTEKPSKAKPRHSVVEVSVQGEGFTKGESHGLHIHEFGKCEGPDYKSAGGHFNPTGKNHGAPSSKSHAGDLGNISSDEHGHFTRQLQLTGASLGEAHSIIGKSLILHAKADDLKTQPSGDSGDRVGCSIIELKK